MAILIKWNILWLLCAMCRVGKGALGSLGKLCSLHLTRMWALGQTANAVDGTALTCIGWWVTVAEHRLSPGRDKRLC